jgi:hypothetical protein
MFIEILVFVIGSLLYSSPGRQFEFWTQGFFLYMKVEVDYRCKGYAFLWKIVNDFPISKMTFETTGWWIHWRVWIPCGEYAGESQLHSDEYTGGLDFWSVRYQHQNWCLIQQGVKTPLCIRPVESMYVPWFIWHKQVFCKPILVDTPCDDFIEGSHNSKVVNTPGSQLQLQITPHIFETFFVTFEACLLGPGKVLWWKMET